MKINKANYSREELVQEVTDVLRLVPSGAANEDGSLTFVARSPVPEWASAAQVLVTLDPSEVDMIVRLASKK